MKKWYGSTPKNCDICNEPIEDIFIDGKTDMGPWATMCPSCHAKCGKGLGMGTGQMYKKEGDVWYKIEG